MAMTLRSLHAQIAYRLRIADRLFIHIPKNAGVAVRKAPELRWRLVGVEPQFLRSRSYVRDLKAQMLLHNQHHGFAHARWRDVDPRVTARLQAVAVLRNPWARTVSRYRFAQLAVEQGTAFSVGDVSSFEAFLEQRHIYGNEPYFWHRAILGWYPQADYVTDEAGGVRADLLRHEKLDTEVPAYFGLDHPIRRRNVTSRGAREDWRSLYTPQTIQIVADWYARDVDLFGFDFDTPATRNIWSAR